MPSKTEDLPAMEGKGVAPLKISAIDRAIAKYQKAKETRCLESPKEVAAKSELKDLLHKHRADLPMDEEGNPFYRSDGRDYVLTEKLKVAKVTDGSDDSD